MKSPAFAYERPASVDDALAILAEHADTAKVLAGGQSLMPLLNLRLTYPDVIIDLGRLTELTTSSVDDDNVRIGALTTHATVEDGRIPDVGNGLLGRVARGIGYRAIRNRGTVGGSLVHADPSAEWPIVFTALDATLRIRSSRGERTVPLRSFYRGHFVTELEPDELAVAVEVPAGTHSRTRTGFHKHSRKFGEFAESLAVALVDVADDQTIERVVIWLGAAAEVPLDVSAAADVLTGDRWSPTSSNRLRAVVHDVLAGDPARDDAPDERYRRHLHTVTVCRAIDDAMGVTQ